MRSRSFNRRFTPGHPGFDALKQPGFAYRVEKRVSDVYIPVNAHKSIEAALRYVKDKPDWDTRIVRIKDGTVMA